MRQLSSSGQQRVADIAQRHGFSLDGTLAMLDAVLNGNGSMAQFNHPDFAGPGQWMQGGMTMVSDMFNQQLTGRVNALCAELSDLVASQPDLVRSGSFQSQSQGDGTGTGYGGVQQAQVNPWSVPAPATGGASSDNNLFQPPAAGTDGDWWPSDLRWPDSTGAQNGTRYANFSSARRLAIDVGGVVTVYDTLDHQIGGFSQQQSGGASFSFSSQYGPVDVASLPVISCNGQVLAAALPPMAPVALPNVPQPPLSAAFLPQGSPPEAGGADVFATIEKLAALRAKGILSEEEFSAKKAELLSRL